MKSFTQVALFGAVVVVLVGGLAFVGQFFGPRPAPRGPLPTGPAPAKEDVLFFPRKAVKGDDDLTEVRRRRHFDFWFVNPKPAAVEVGLKSLDHPAVRVKVGLLSPLEARDWLAGRLANRLEPLAHPLFRGASEVAVWQWEQRLLDAPNRWHELTPDGWTVPASIPEGRTVGVIRLECEGEGPGRLDAVARLWVGRKADGPVESLRVSHLTLVPAVRVDTAELKLKDLGPRSQESAEFNCWSETRGTFYLEPRKETLGPNMDLSLEPLSAEQCDALAREHMARVLSGYRGRLTVHERRDGKAMPLGPLEQKLVLDGPEGTEPVTLTLRGRVRGEVRIVSGDDSMSLGEFPAARGIEKSVLLGAEEEKVELQLDSYTPASIKAELTPAKTTDGMKRWELLIRVPPRAVAGPLPADSAVYLLVKGEVTRKLKLPLSGQGTQ